MSVDACLRCAAPRCNLRQHASVARLVVLCNGAQAWRGAERVGSRVRGAEQRALTWGWVGLALGLTYLATAGCMRVAHAPPHLLGDAALLR